MSTYCIAERNPFSSTLRNPGLRWATLLTRQIFTLNNTSFLVFRGHCYSLGCDLQCLAQGCKTPVLEAALSAGICGFFSVSCQWRPWEQGVSQTMIYINHWCWNTLDTVAFWSLTPVLKTLWQLYLRWNLKTFTCLLYCRGVQSWPKGTRRGCRFCLRPGLEWRPP